MTRGRLDLPDPAKCPLAVESSIIDYMKATDMEGNQGELLMALTGGFITPDDVKTQVFDLGANPDPGDLARWPGSRLAHPARLRDRPRRPAPAALRTT